MMWIEETFISKVFDLSTFSASESISTFFPAFDVFKTVVQISAGSLFGFILAASLLKKYFKNIKMTVLFLLILTVTFSLNASSWKQYAWQVGGFMLTALFICWISVKYFRFNAASYFLLVFTIGILAEFDILMYSNIFYRINGALILAILILPMLYFLYANFRRRRKEAPKIQQGS